MNEVNILTDLCGSVAEVAAVTRTSEGRQRFEQYLGVESVEAMRATCWGREGTARDEFMEDEREGGDVDEEMMLA